MNTCAGCQHDRGGYCRARAPMPSTAERLPDRAVWPRHDGQGCGEYAAPTEPEPQRTGKTIARREKMSA